MEATLVLKQCININSKLACSVITRIELMTGMRPEEEGQIEGFLANFESIPVTDRIAKYAGIYMNRYRKSFGINMADAIIAATTRSINSKLFTLNTKHYPMDDINIVKPY